MRAVFGLLFDGILRDLRPKLSLADGDHRVVTFDLDVAGFDGNPEGLNLIRLGRGGEIEDVTVFIRPLGAIEAISREMGLRMGGPRHA